MSKTPNIRFNGFSDNWKEKQLSEIFVIKNNKNKNQYSRDSVLSVSDYEGCVNQIKFHGRSFAGKDISNYKIADIGDIIYTKSPLQSKPYGIVKIVTEEAGIVSPLYVVNVPTKENDSLFMYYLFDSPERTNKYLEPLVRKGAKNTMNISDSEWLSGSVVVSENLEEQQKIGLLFKKIDDLINVETAKIDELSKIKQALLLKMFPTKNEDTPSIRFKDFTDTWEQCKVDDILVERNEQYPQNDKYPLMAFVANIGVAPKGEKYDRSALVNDVENKSYKRTEYGDFIYSSNNLETGSIGLNKYGKATISPVYSIFKPTEIADSDFIGKLLVRKTFINEMIKWRQGVIYGQWKIHESNFLKIKIDIPSIQEQKQIGFLFDKIDTLITLHQRKLDKLKEVKSALLDKLLV